MPKTWPGRSYTDTRQLRMAQVRLGQMLAKRVTPACIKVGDVVWMDSKHTPNDVPYKLTARWFGPFKVLEVRGARAILDLPPSFGKTHNRIHMSRLKFFEARDANLGEGDTAPDHFWDMKA